MENNSKFNLEEIERNSKEAKGSLSTPETKQLIESCKKALSNFVCSQCEKKVWALEASDYVQCQCGSTKVESKMKSGIVHIPLETIMAIP